MERTRFGLYDGFEGYRTPTKDDLRGAVRSSLVVLDTNVLLNLYDVHGTTLDDFIKVFDALGERLFIPHQVMDEFWRNRRTVIAENQGKHRERDRIEESFSDIRATFTKWYSRVVERGGMPPKDRIRELDEAVAALLDYIDDQTQLSNPTTPDTPTQDDHVLARLEHLLNGHVGPAPEDTERERLVREGEARVKKKVPPGYMDAVKSPDRAVGDFLVWHQTIAESRARGLPVLLVTQDLKEDWWADRGTSSMRARPELVAELRREAQQALLMIRSFDLLELGEHVGVTVSKQALEEARTEASGASPWTPELAAHYLVMLGQRNPEHLVMLMDAAGDEEYSITREAIAELLGRSADSSMRGLSRPFDTVLKILADKEGLDEKPPNPMYAWYADNNVMSHMVLDNSIVPVIADALELARKDIEVLVGDWYDGSTVRA